MTVLYVEQTLLTFPVHLSYPGFQWGNRCSIFSFLCCVLQIIVCPFFLWPLHCLSFYDIPFLITLLVNSNFSFFLILAECRYRELGKVVPTDDSKCTFNVFMYLVSSTPNREKVYSIQSDVIKCFLDFRHVSAFFVLMFPPSMTRDN